MGAENYPLYNLECVKGISAYSIDKFSKQKSDENDNFLLTQGEGCTGDYYPTAESRVQFFANSVQISCNVVWLFEQLVILYCKKPV